MGQADATPDKEEAKTGKGKEPAKDLSAIGSATDVGEETEGELDKDTPERATLVVDVREELGGHAALSHSLHGSGRTESARVGDREDRDGDDGVEDAGEDLDTGILDGDDEGGSLGVGTAGTHETLISVGEDETENEQVQDIEDGNSPKHLLASLGDRLAGVGRLGSSKTDHLSTSKGEGSDDEDGAETLEGGESTRVLPVLGTDVALVTDTARVDDNTEDDETDTGADLDAGEDKLNLTITSDTEKLNNDQGKEEDTDPDGHVDVISPELDCDGRGDEFEGEDG